jgi:hypothetical protein
MSEAAATYRCKHCGGIHDIDERNPYPCALSRVAHEKEALLDSREADLRKRVEEAERLLTESQTSIGGDWRERRDAFLRAATKPQP